MFEKLEGKTITFDIDGVLSNSGLAVVNDFNYIFKTNRIAKEITHWNSIKCWAMDLGKSDEEAKEIEKSLWFRPEVIGKAEPVPGAYSLLRSLWKADVNMKFITSRPSNLNDVTKEFFDKHFSFIDLDNVISNPMDDLGEASKFKIKKIAEISPIYHIEDSPTQINAIIKAAKHTHVIAVPNTYNMDIVESRRVTVSRRLENTPNLWPVYLLLADK